MWNIDLPDTRIIENTGDEYQQLLNELRDTPIISLDTETTGLDRMHDLPLFWTLAWGRDRIQRAFLPSSMLSAFKELFDETGRAWVMQNAKFDMHMLANMGTQIAGDVYDTMVMHAMLYEDSPHGLKEMSKQVLGWGWRSFEDTFMLRSPKSQKVGDVLLQAWKNDKHTLVEYASNDAYGTLALFWSLDEQMSNAPTIRLADRICDCVQENEVLSRNFYEVEAPFTKVLWKCERRGAAVDIEHLERAGIPVEADLLRLGKKLAQMSGGKVLNPNSNEQLREYLTVDVGLPILKKTKGGKKGLRLASIDEEVLKRYSEDHRNDFSAVLLEYRALAKLYGTYILGLSKHITEWGTIHTKLNQVGTVTGRLSSSDPNLTNIPRADEDLYRIREAFTAGSDPHDELLVADYKALEMRVLGAVAREQDMLQIFRDGKDIHMGNAELVFQLPYEDINKAKKIDKDVKEGRRPESDLDDYVRKCLKARFDIKAVAFGTNYGMKENNLARRIHSTPQEAKAIQEAYFERYPGVRKSFDNAVIDAQKTGYAFTFLGRRRRIADIFSSRAPDRWRAERMTSNVPIQGCIPASTRILTGSGYLPVGEAPQLGTVWTGTEWANYNKLDRGPCELATIRLSNGQVLKCDTRHKVLVLESGEYQFKKWADLAIGDQVCLSMARELEFGEDALVEDSYWMGFSIGNGCTANGSGHKNALTLVFGDRKGRYYKEQAAQHFAEYCRCVLHVEPQRPQVHPGKITITVESKAAKAHLVSLGYPWGTTHHTKTVPTSIWTSNLENRKEFLRGLLDADGSVGVKEKNSPNLHLCQRPLLEQAQMLFRTVGVESILRDLGDGSYRLDLNGSQLAKHLGYGYDRQSPKFPGMRASAEAVREIMRLPRGNAVHQTIQHRVKQSLEVGPYTAQAMFTAGGVAPPLLYATRTVIGTEALGVTETTYTLSVHSPLHRFDSEGVISKNSAADVVKMAMIHVENERMEERFGYKMFLQVHDELLLRGPKDTGPEARALLKQCMEGSLEMDLGVVFEVDIGQGPNWAKCH